MAKRYMSTDLFHEDWFVELETDIKLFYIYSLLNCDHAGFLRVNFRVFNALNSTLLTPDTAFEAINKEKPRFQKISDRVWFLPDFIPYQYGDTFNPRNRVHHSVASLLEKNGIDIKGLGWGSDGASEGVKEKEKEKDRDEDIEIVGDCKGGLLPPIPDTSEIEQEFKRALTQLYLPETAHGGYQKLAAAFFGHYQSQGWKKGNDMRIFDWRPLVHKWIAIEKGRKGSTQSSTTKHERPWDN
jgi:hypothetical protein